MPKLPTWAWVVLLAVVGFVVWKYVIKPRMAAAGGGGESEPGAGPPARAPVASIPSGAASVTPAGGPKESRPASAAKSTRVGKLMAFGRRAAGAAKSGVALAKDVKSLRG